ncbi:aldolase/citrate lyase family protein [Galactobacter sp.]|uniref:HpcH/HpaI aldolase family protein n=1 Tax=Galactobacter sp. TaxID=2676125 RepID=UPI0025C00E59|nr:aldolase/citrate lyase family protein [Galactobacter sp.]
MSGQEDLTMTPVQPMTPVQRGGDATSVVARILSGERTIGTFAGLGSTTAIEVLAAAGLDWVLVDLEHGGGDESQVGDAVAAAGAYGAATLVRVESAERIRIGRVLDAGAAGVMLPRIASAEQVEESLKHFSYPPLGDRGVATYNRSVRWGLDKAALEADPALVIVQIETLGALDQVERIAAIPGVDVLFIGPLDLSYALGTPLDFSSEPFKAAVDRVIKAAKDHGKSAGILSATTDIAAGRAEEGFTFLPVGSDATLLVDAARGIISTLA